MLRNFLSREGITSTIFAIMSFGSSLPSGTAGSPSTTFLKASRSIKFTSSLGGTPWKLQMSMEPECGGGLPLHLYSATSRR